MELEASQNQKQVHDKQMHVNWNKMKKKRKLNKK